MICPFSQNECTPECGVYNPYLKGCSLMVNQLALGEEIAKQRKEVSQISENLLIFTNSLIFSLNHVLKCIEKINSTMENFDCKNLVNEIDKEGHYDESVHEDEHEKVHD